MSDTTRAALAGSLAAAAALAASELVAGLMPVPSLVESVGNVVIDNVPPPVKDWAIAVFGVYDKVALIVGMALVALLIGAVVGVAAARHMWIGVGALAAFGMLGTAAAVVDGESAPAALLGGSGAVLAGLVVLSGLLRRIGPPGGIGSRPGDPEKEPDAGRRAFLVAAGATVLAIGLSAGAGRILIQRSRRTLARREAVTLPAPAVATTPPIPEMEVAVGGVSPLITPNSDFYRIDTALSVPRVDLDTWTLTVHGLVERPYQVDFRQLLEMDMVERYVTLSCVSNTVGGGLVGNAKWLGVPLVGLLERAGVLPEGTQVVGRSVDDFTVGFPTAAVFDGREALVAVGMNDEPLPPAHGFPARLVVAGLYGYVSATKWLSEIEITTWEAFDAYWVPRGWAKEGPVKTQSRIDTPRGGSQVGAEPRAIAGVAWAPNIGIQRVEVQIDDHGWADADLAEPLDDDSWRQWKLDWTPSPGRHTIRVRATDRSGYTQTGETAPPAPDGATGWHTISVSVA